VAEGTMQGLWLERHAALDAQNYRSRFWIVLSVNLIALLTQANERRNMSTSQHLESTGRLCTIFQRGHGAIVKALQALDIQPDVTINGIPHYSSETVDKLREHFAAGGKRTIAGRTQPAIKS
jgi:hypothetical protein